MVLRTPKYTDLTEVRYPIIVFSSPAASALLGYTPYPYPSSLFPPCSPPPQGIPPHDALHNTNSHTCILPVVGG